MLQIQILRRFVQTDTNTSVQALMSKSSSPAKEVVALYDEIIRVSDKIKFKSRLTFKEKLLAARYYKSISNELKGKTMRYGNSLARNQNNQ